MFLESHGPFSYRRKPIRVEAIRWKPGLTEREVPYWFAAAIGGRRVPTSINAVQVGPSLQVTTTSGTAIAHEGDWIVRSRTGEVSVETSDAFQQRYERDEKGPKLRSWHDDRS
jgi:hypothetical protein